MGAPGLKEFLLPQLVEARKRQKSELDPESPKLMGHAQQASGSSTISDLPSPTTPTFSLRGHVRLSSSSSSLVSSPNMRESMDGFASANRPLTDVKEEAQDKDEDIEMTDGFNEGQAPDGE